MPAGRVAPLTLSLLPVLPRSPLPQDVRKAQGP